MLDAAGSACHAISIFDVRMGLYRVWVQLRKVGEDASKASLVRIEMDRATWGSIPHADG